MPTLNPYLTAAGGFTSKAISDAAKRNPAILNLSIGEPAFGPPEHLLPAVAELDLTLPNFVDATRRYQQSRGSPALREAIAGWYRRHHQLEIDPERELLVTHGGIEALAVAVATVTEPGATVAVADPAYTLYARAINVLGRRLRPLQRPPGGDEYLSLLDAGAAAPRPLAGVQALLVNSPENPTGYVASVADWRAIAAAAERDDVWLLHDEVYDTMAFSRHHQPARCIDSLGERSLLINSCSKKFGVPGLRIGWIAARPAVIDAAVKAHDCLCLGVNILFEQVATRFLNDPDIDRWCADQQTMLAARTHRARQLLGAERGYRWPREPLGGMFLFPDIAALAARLPDAAGDPGLAVIQHLLRTQQIASVPGSAYGEGGRHHIRLTTCGPAAVFDAALARLATTDLPEPADIA